MATRKTLSLSAAALCQPDVEMKSCRDATAVLDLFFEMRPQVVLLDLA
jgi:hypothetical protein